ncbi:MAG: prepilin-type N-terminal cleavage/methylation domain-containing protein [Lachnospiraceae bacterium]|nr:prepilin-type N-terminal cleavage/methylation domain-containing protein [Lachnospiraceae bacterium]
MDLKRKRYTRILRDERGSTLIEVIVSVLIVAVAFVPLLIGLHAALRVNRTAEVELYAENAATNLVEITKTYGTDGMKALAEAQGLNSSDGIAKLINGATMTKNASGNIFTVSNINSGTDKVYSAVIEFSNWDDKQNDFSGYPAVEGVADALIVNIGEDKLEEIINYYWDYAHTNYNTSVTKEQLKNDVASWLKREIKVSCVQGTGDDASKIIFSKIVTYKAENVEINGNYLYQTSSNTGPATPYECQERQIAKKSSVPQSIIVTFKPLRDRQGKDYQLADDVILVDKEVSGAVHLYSFCENGATLKSDGYAVTVKFNDTSSDAITDRYGYSNLNFGVTDCTPEYTFGSGTTGKQSKMRNIKVTIKDTDGNQLFEKTTSMIEVE